MHRHKQSRAGRQHRHVQAEESRQRRAGHFVAATEEPDERFADDWNGAWYARAVLGREEGEFIPGQEIAAKAKAEHDEEQKTARDPRQLAWLAIGLEQPHAEQVDEYHTNEQIGRPAVDVA